MDNSTPYKASEYDAKVRQTIPYYETIHKEVLRLVQLIKPDVNRWVDTGCGTGCLVEQALAEFPRCRFVLADPAESMLVEARKRLAAAQEWVTILPTADSAELMSRIGRGTADVITAIQCHHYLPHGRLKALQSCFEVLKPGGLIVTFEHVAPRTPEGLSIGLTGWKSFLIAQGRTEEEADKNLARYGKEFFPIKIDQHLQLLTEAGFGISELFWFSRMQAGFYAIKEPPAILQPESPAQSS
jgi:tRNA (cmo5U34)-methyltransferase